LATADATDDRSESADDRRSESLLAAESDFAVRFVRERWNESAARANVKAVQRMLGHASAAMTLDVYADLFDDDLDPVAARLDEGLSRTDVGKMWADAARGEEKAR
jgi:integrase